jgi:hypothetical protein
MSVRNASRLSLVLVAAIAAGGVAACFRSTAPAGWLTKPEEVSQQAFGSWIRLQDDPRTPSRVFEGELIAVDADTIHILVDRLVSLPTASFCCTTVTAFHMDYSPLVMWGAIGTLSTVSHGVGLILSAPFWVLATTSAAASASAAPRIVSTDAVALRPYARFPQGIPSGLDRKTLRPKPWEPPSERGLRQ